MPYPSPLRQLFRAIIGFPVYFFGWTIGLAVAVLTDLHITTLAISGVLVGLARESVIDGFVAFFILYTLSRIFSNIADAVGIGLNNNAKAIRDTQ